MTNQPVFDPLNCSREEEDEMVRGYFDGRHGHPLPPFTTIAYEHGRRNGVNDRAGVVEAEQAELARRAQERAAEIRDSVDARIERLRAAGYGRRAKHG